MVLLVSDESTKPLTKYGRRGEANIRNERLLCGLSRNNGAYSIRICGATWNFITVRHRFIGGFIDVTIPLTLIGGPFFSTFASSYSSPFGLRM